MEGINGTDGGLSAIVAIKRLDGAKTRLAPSLTGVGPADRSGLVLAMLTDTIRAAAAVDAVAVITVVTPDPVAAATARALGAQVLDDRTPAGHPDPLNAAVRAAARTVSTPNLLVLQGDLPALQPAELEAAARAAAGRRAFVADRHGTGTNALFARRAHPAPRFGTGSAQAHAATGAVELTGPWPGLRCDVDTGADLHAAVDLGVGPTTAAALCRLGLAGVPC